MIYNLTAVPQLASFPWDSVYTGLAKSRKTVTTFYGDVHSTKYTHTADSRWTDKDQWRWFNALRHGVNIDGFNVSLTALPNEKMAFANHWWARSHEPGWLPTDNMRFFDDLQAWIKQSGIFNSTGRQVFFIQISGQGSPVHTDFDPASVPVHLRAPGEFIWLTPPDRPKRLTISGELAPWCCWFNHFEPHGCAPETDTRWSLRIDGSFTDDFKSKYLNC